MTIDEKMEMITNVDPKGYNNYISSVKTNVIFQSEMQSLKIPANTSTLGVLHLYVLMHTQGAYSNKFKSWQTHLRHMQHSLSSAFSMETLLSRWEGDEGKASPNRFCVVFFYNLTLKLIYWFILRFKARHKIYSFSPL